MLESGELGMRLRGGRGETETEDEEKKIKLMTKVGLWCIQYNSRDRPCMGSVVQMLQGNGDDVANPALPFNISSDVANPPLPFNISPAAPEIPAAPEMPLLCNTEEASSIDM